MYQYVVMILQYIATSVMRIWVRCNAVTPEGPKDTKEVVFYATHKAGWTPWWVARINLRTLKWEGHFCVYPELDTFRWICQIRLAHAKWTFSSWKNYLARPLSLLLEGLAFRCSNSAVVQTWCKVDCNAEMSPFCSMKRKTKVVRETSTVKTRAAMPS